MQEATSGRAQRRHLADVAINRQVLIAKAHDAATPLVLACQRGRFRKQHAMDCGNPQCGLCSNARRNPNVGGAGKLTKQERVHLERMDGEVRELFIAH